ncbi:MAG: hydroxymethylbilane synthase [Bacteroidota bacterium]
MTHRLRLGTRTTPLALWQAEHVAHALRLARPDVDVDLVPFVTEGDRRLAVPLPEIGGKGVFTAELEAALHARSIDLAVHSLKDLPVEQPAGLTLGAILARADVRDAWVAPSGHLLDDLPTGAVVGTSSLRRGAQLLAHRPDLSIQPIRGSVGTRLKKVKAGQYAATVLALAGLQRLDMENEVTAILDLDVMLPAPGQAALAVQCLDEPSIVELLAAIDDQSTNEATTAERQWLYHLGGGCSAPIAAYAYQQEGVMHLDGAVFAPSGDQSVRVHVQGTDPAALGRAAAAEALRQQAGDLLPNHD